MAEGRHDSTSQQSAAPTAFPEPGNVRAGMADWLGLNPSTLALLGTIVLVTAATELWSPLIPEYLKKQQQDAGAGSMTAIIVVGLFGFYRDALEALNYYVGGAISGRLNARRSLLMFNFLPLAGLLILATWDSTLAVFLAIPFIFAWDSIAGPATITVVGDSLRADRRTMAFSLQHIFRRLARIFAYWISAPLVWYFGREQGVQVDAVIALVFVLGAAVLQFKFMRTTTRDREISFQRPRHLLRRFDPNLRRLLAADILARWAEGLAGPLIILFAIPILAADRDRGAALYQCVLLTLQAATSMVLYVVVGPLASREGLAKKPYINLTFVFFALFPLSLLLGLVFGPLGLAIAFVIGGMREIGEPARKAMIADLAPEEVRTQAIGIYWSARSAAVMLASPVGALLWLGGERLRPGSGPILTFTFAGAVGLIGALVFYATFGRTQQR